MYPYTGLQQRGFRVTDLWAKCVYRCSAKLVFCNLNIPSLDDDYELGRGSLTRCRRCVYGVREEMNVYHNDVELFMGTYRHHRKSGAFVALNKI